MKKQREIYASPLDALVAVSKQLSLCGQTHTSITLRRTNNW